MTDLVAMVAKALAQARPCPFCGGDPQNLDLGWEHSAWHVICKSGLCGARGPMSNTPEGAVRMWNRAK